MASQSSQSVQQFRLPDPGEGLTEADIVAWKVKVGDTVAVNDLIVEIETAKSLVELPCPFAGVVTGLLVAEGDTVAVGTPILAVDTGGGAGAAPQPPPAQEPATQGNGRTAVLVGYGPRETEGVRRRRRPTGPAAAPTATATPTAPTTPNPPRDLAFDLQPEAARPAHVLAKPPVRLLAKQLGVDLTAVTPSGEGGIVTRDDVQRAVAQPAGDVRPADDAAVTRVPVKGVRRATAQAMVASAFTAPHVTEWVQVDVTRSMRLVERLRADRAFADVRVSPLLLVARALLLAVRRFPDVNASWDDAAGEIVRYRDVNLGIAAATPRGLLVPNVKAADRLDLHDLGLAINRLADTAREGRTTPAEQAGGTITITNVGVFGVDGGTPILNPGEAAILAVGQVRELPWVHRGKVRPRQVMQLSLSFDHRLVDGELGSRVLAATASVLERPELALLWA